MIVTLTVSTLGGQTQFLPNQEASEQTLNVADLESNFEVAVVYNLELKMFASSSLAVNTATYKAHYKVIHSPMVKQKEKAGFQKDDIKPPLESKLGLYYNYKDSKQPKHNRKASRRARDGLQHQSMV